MNNSEGIENTQEAAHGPAYVRGLSICRFGVVAKGPEVSPHGALRDYCTLLEYYGGGEDISHVVPGEDVGEKMEPSLPAFSLCYCGPAVTLWPPLRR